LEEELKARLETRQIGQNQNTEAGLEGQAKEFEIDGLGYGNLLLTVAFPCVFPSYFSLSD
jgi:hypothetical protein